MATWGQLTIQTNEYNKEDTLYYSYGTSSDIFHFIFTYLDNEWGGSGGIEKFEEFISNERGEAQMEAYINHYLAMNCSGDVDLFVERYVNNNRFKLEREKRS